jgi:molecular chaperone DnaK
MADPVALGLDLGTTFSVIAQVNQAGVPAVLPNAEGSPTTPSVVLFDGATAVVGAVAKESLATDPDTVVQLVKRHMGSEWVFEYGGIAYRPEHISSLIIRKLHQDAQLLTGSTNELAITVPAYFNDPMRLATRRAGELAGADILGLLSEPTAAALAFGYEKRPTGTTGVVIDLGGGTFDVTVMDYDGHNLNVRATGGDAYLGGANFDKVLFDLFVERFRAAHGLDLNDPSALSLEEFTHASRDWLARANRAKHDLSVRDHATVALQVAGLTLRVEVDRGSFLARSRILLDEMTEKMIDVVSAAGITPNDVQVVLTVGGSTRMPVVRERIRDIFGVDPETSVRPDEAVALGAALFAARQQMERGAALVMQPDAMAYLEKLTVHDVAAHTVGISAINTEAGGEGRLVVVPVLSRNTALPFEMRRSFYTMCSGETRIIVPVLEGEHEDPGLCRRIGEVRIDDLPPGRPAYQQVDVTMRLDRDGILEVSAVDVATGTAAATTIVHTHDGMASDAGDAAARALSVN